MTLTENLFKILGKNSNSFIFNIPFESLFPALDKERKDPLRGRNQYELLYELQETFVSDLQVKTNVV